jgi:predicted CopG family antitoxin
MTSRTIKISEETYRWLLDIATDLQKQRGTRVSFDEALGEIKEKKKKKNIMDLAGKWKLSDKEAKELLNGIYKERKIISRRI